jgi:hypothetical protein
MRQLISIVLLLTVLAAVGACRNPSLQGGTGSNGGGGATFHSGIPF